jgi:hypothetical protein
MSIIKDSADPFLLDYVPGKKSKETSVDVVKIAAHLAVSHYATLQKIEETNRLVICDFNGKEFTPNRKRTLAGRLTIIEHAPRLVSDGNLLYERVDGERDEEGLPTLEYRLFNGTEPLELINGHDFVYLRKTAEDYLTNTGICSAEEFKTLQKRRRIEYFEPKKNKRGEHNPHRIYLLKDLHQISLCN